jgi:hypothetical protein
MIPGTAIRVCYPSGGPVRFRFEPVPIPEYGPPAQTQETRSEADA